MSYIPVIDFGSCNPSAPISQQSLETVGEDLTHAFCTVGFAYLSNTGIYKEDVDKVNNATKSFFTAPTDVKNQYERNNDLNYGYSGLCVERVNLDRPADYKEAYDISGKAFLQDATEYKWPDKEFPEFRGALTEFAGKCKQLTLRILRALAAGMKLKDEEYFERCHSLMNTEGNLTTMRTLYYRPLPDSLPPGQVRLGEHSDYGSITLLFQDEIGGLEIENKEGEYVPATPLENTVIVNIGDILQFWTQGKLKSTRHRVMIPDDKDKRVIVRRSMVYFVRPDNDVIINDPLAYRDKEETKEPNVTPITSHQYSMMKFNKTFKY